MACEKQRQRIAFLEGKNPTTKEDKAQTKRDLYTARYLLDRCLKKQEGKAMSKKFVQETLKQHPKYRKKPSNYKGGGILRQYD